MSATARIVPALLAALAALACRVGPDYAAPEVALPAAWSEAGAESLPAEPAALAAWWRTLDDPLLDELVLRATRDALDLREAFARVQEARAMRGASASGLWPRLDATLGYERSGESRNTPFGAFVPDNDRFSVGFDASWELDLWGRVRRSLEASDAALEASVEDLRAAWVSVAAEVARTYVDLRAFRRRLAIGRDNVSLQEQTLDLVRARFEAGLVGESDVAQARTNVERTRSSLPRLEASVHAAENRLAVLVGQPPGALASLLAADAPIPAPPADLAVGVPADLLRRRADVRRAERLLAAETARIGVAEAELYPRLSLAGRLGLAAQELRDVPDASSNTFGYGPSLRWNVFDAGRLRRLVDAQEARTEQALVRWERAVLVALEEAENAMSAARREEARRASLAEGAAQARLAVELARTQYTEGLSDFQSVLVAERALADLEDELAASEAARTTDAVALYKALGGGWDEPVP